MDTARIEAWVLDIVERLKARQPIEDSRVELKGVLISADKAARRIAGHANAARGEQILWVIGVDEKAPDHPVIGVNAAEFSDWWNGVVAQFVELPPAVKEVNVPTDGQTVLALLIETERAPFVVKNPRHGSPEGGSVATEVPWREGTSTRSARRSDLIRLLAPVVNLPEPEVRNCEVSVGFDDRKPAQWQYIVHVDLYLRMRIDGQVLVFPDHDATGKVTVDGQVLALESIVLTAPREGRSFFGGEVTRSTSQRGAHQLLVEGPGPIYIGGHTRQGEGPVNPSTDRNVSVRLVIQAIDSPRPLTVAAECSPGRSDFAESIRRMRWRSQPA